MKKQTAVDWLIDQIRLAVQNEDLNAITISKLKMEAKGIEIEQIVQSFVDGVDSGSLFDSIDYYIKKYKI